MRFAMSTQRGRAVDEELHGASSPAGVAADRAVVAVHGTDPPTASGDTRSVAVSTGRESNPIAHAYR
jgi:hypothetical protein